MEKTHEAGIYRLKSGRLRVRATIKCPRSGKTVERQKTLKESTTMTEAIQIRDHLKDQMRAESIERPPAPQQSHTVGDYAEQWLKRKAKRMKPSTAHKYIRVLSEYVLPQLGHLGADEITRRTVSDWIRWAEEQRREDGRRYSRSTVKGWWRVLRILLKDAHAEGYIAHDLTIRQTSPDTGVGSRQEKRTLTSAQLGALVDATRELYPTRYAEVVTAAYTGMRIGELYGLEWRDIDLSAGRLKIQRATWRGVVSSTKTDAPREIPLPGIVVAALSEHRKTQMREQPPGFDEGIVFPSTTGGRRYSSSLCKPMGILSEHLGLDLKVSPQVLRRTFNTLMVAGQVDRIVLRAMMGHSSEQMTQRYSGVGFDVKQAALERVFGGGEKN